MDGKPAFVEYISSGQVNVQVPANVETGGLAPVVVTNSNVTSGTDQSLPFMIQSSSTEPGILATPLFKVNGNQYAVAILSDGSYAAPTGAIPGVTTRPAHPGETMIIYSIYSIGFGSTSPYTPPGEMTGQNQILPPVILQLDGVSAGLAYAGLAPSFVGLYQFNVVVPNVATSDLVQMQFFPTATQTIYTAVQ